MTSDETRTALLRTLQAVVPTASVLPTDAYAALTAHEAALTGAKDAEIARLKANEQLLLNCAIGRRDLALRAFADAMTPEMWADVAVSAKVIHEEGFETVGDRTLLALDALRAALTKE